MPKRPMPKGPKPAIAPKPVILPKPVIAAKPKVLQRQGVSCDQGMGNKPKPSGKKTTPKSTSMSVLSPFDLDKEWDNITKFMDTLSTQMGWFHALEHYAYVYCCHTITIHVS